MRARMMVNIRGMVGYMREWIASTVNKRLCKIFSSKKINWKRTVRQLFIFLGACNSTGAVETNRDARNSIQGHRQEQGRQKRRYKRGTKSSKNIDNSRVERNSKTPAASSSPGPQGQGTAGT
jgi:hypothetical protein